MKKIAKALIAVLVGIVVAFQPVSVYAAPESDNLSLEDRYYRILASRIAKSPHLAPVFEKNSLYADDFSIFSSINDKPTAEIVAENSNTGEAIIHDTNNDLLIYTDIIDDSQLTMIIEGNRYTIIADEYDIYCVSESGESLKVLEYLPDNPSNEDHSEEKMMAAASGSWILMAQHIKGTNTLLLQAISEIVTISGLVSWNCICPAIGRILVIVGIFTLVGQKKTVTLYTDYDRYYKSDCTTYFRDYVRFYQYNNYTGYAGDGYSYFHSVRPDYAGQNCLAYA
ncbi:hypothetical protein MOZ60_02380 [Stecheria sp. CLA-KB-P133]|uniref:Uncharacterized protein n=1 Tax=Grylomicrobium aquisgranensis TaxID=2926318 RepID=A0AB35U5A2_9FIRM|nr:hypothetical protein [Stecheria sp. CLA-KB-P133]